MQTIPIQNEHQAAKTREALECLDDGIDTPLSHAERRRLANEQNKEYEQAYELAGRLF